MAFGAGVVAGAVVGATIANLHNQRREVVEGGRTVYYEPDRVIISLSHTKAEESAVAGETAEPEVVKRGKTEEGA